MVEIVKNVTDYQLSVVVGGVIVHYNFDFGDEGIGQENISPLIAYVILWR